MARYRVMQASFINGSYVEPGTVIEYDGIPGNNLDVIKTPSEKKNTKKTQNEKENEEKNEEANNVASPEAQDNALTSHEDAGASPKKV